MVRNGLKLNQDKTELLVISSKCRSMPNLDFVQVEVERIELKSTVRNLKLGIVMDQTIPLQLSVRLPSII